MALHGTDLVTDRFFGVEERLGNTTALKELGIHGWYAPVVSSRVGKRGEQWSVRTSDLQVG